MIHHQLTQQCADALGDAGHVLRSFPKEHTMPRPLSETVPMLEARMGDAGWHMHMTREVDTDTPDLNFIVEWNTQAGTEICEGTSDTEQLARAEAVLAATLHLKGERG